MFRTNIFKWTIWLAILVVIILIAINYLPKTRNQQTLQHATILTPTRDLPSFTLQATDGSTFTKKDLYNHWTLLYFGFTRCKTYCPVTLSKVKKMIAVIKQDTDATVPQLLFISVDQNDTIHTLKNYMKSFNPEFVGAKADEANLAKLTKKLGYYFEKVKDHNNYDFAHRNLLFVINPKGQWYGLLSTPHEPTMMANDLAIMIDRYNKGNHHA